MDIHVCPGCEGKENPITEDHYHQYINILGDVVSCYFLEGETLFTTQTAPAINKVRKLYDVDVNDALKYLRSIRMVYC